MLYFICFIVSIFLSGINPAYCENEQISPAESFSPDEWTENLGNLKKSMNEIIRRNEVLLSENNVLRKKVVDIEAELKKWQEDKEQSSKEPVRLNEMLSKKSEEVQTLEKSLQDLQGKVSLLEEDKANLSEKIAQKEERQKTINEELKSLKNQVAQLENNTKGPLDERGKAFKNLETEKAKLNRQLEESKSLQAKLEKDLSDLKKRSNVRLDKGNAALLSESQTQLKEELAKVKGEMEAIILERQRLQDDNTRILINGKEEAARLNGEIENLRAQNKELSAGLSQLKKNPVLDKKSVNQEVRKDLDMENKVSSLEKENHSLKDKVASHMESIVQLNREKAIIESLLDVQSKTIKQQKTTSAVKDNHQLAGYKYAASGQYEKAVAEYEQAVKLNPSQRDIYYNLGFLYDKLKQYDNAIANYQKVLGFDPNDKEANLNLYKIYKKLSDDKTAETYYNKYQELQKK